MAHDFARALAVEQRRRLVGSLMEFAERQLYPHLTRELQQAFRQKVMQSVGSYHDLMLDMLKASINDGSVVNEEALSLLEEIHGLVRDR